MAVGVVASAARLPRYPADADPPPLTREPRHQDLSERHRLKGAFVKSAHETPPVRAQLTTNVCQGVDKRFRVFAPLENHSNNKSRFVAASTRPSGR